MKHIDYEAIGHRACVKCGVDKPIAEFGTMGVGRRRARCRECVCEDSIIHYHKRKEDPVEEAKIRKVHADWYNKNKATRIPQCIEYAREHRKRCPQAKLRMLMRARMRRVLRGLVKSGPTMWLVGTDIDTLKSYLEAQFRPGMTWENHGPVWEIDHIRPLASFDLTKPEEQKLAFHFSNLQPLWKTENRRKSKKYTPSTTKHFLNPNTESTKRECTDISTTQDLTLT